jgi:single-strand DNA-binding protein
MNIISITGNVTRDAETRYLPKGDAVANFSVADNQGKDKQAIFWNCQLFGKRAEALAQYLTKGQPVTVSGEVTEREWDDKDGNKRKTMEVRVVNVALQGGKKDVAQGQQKQEQQFSTPDRFIDTDIPF